MRVWKLWFLTKKDDPKDMNRQTTMTGEKATNVKMEHKVEYDKWTIAATTSLLPWSSLYGIVIV